MEAISTVLLDFYNVHIYMKGSCPSLRIEADTVIVGVEILLLENLTSEYTFDLLIDLFRGAG